MYIYILSEENLHIEPGHSTEQALDIKYMDDADDYLDDMSDEEDVMDS